MKRLLWFSLIVMALPSASAAQTGSIKGRVLRETDNKPLYNATVRLKDSKRSARTDNDGNYTFDGVPAGQDYELAMTKRPIYGDGGTTVHVEANVPNPAADVSLSKLAPNAIERRKTVEDLDALFREQNFDQLEINLAALVARCEGEDDAFCKDVEGLGKAVKKRKFEIAKAKLGILFDKAK